mgnify:FL=1
MGKVVKHIIAGNSTYPKYDSWVIEQNADDKVHFHLKNIRMDLTLNAYNQFYDIIKIVNHRQKQSAQFKIDPNNEIEIKLDALYKKYLNREPDQEGFSHYLSLLEKGELSEEQLENEFINCPEYKSVEQPPDQKSVYEIDKDMGLFTIKSKEDKDLPIEHQSHLTIDQQTIDKIKKYSLLDNNIVEIYQFIKGKSVCKFYPNLLPMVIINENNFYEDKIFLERSKTYTKFLNNFNKVSHLYNKIVDSYIDFIENTGCYFQDMSGNNILIDSEYSKFKIIDVFSIEKITKNQSIIFSPVAIFMSAKLAIKLDEEDKIAGNSVVSCNYGLHNPRADPILFKYLKDINYKKINDTILSKINVRSYTKK